MARSFGAKLALSRAPDLANVLSPLPAARSATVPERRTVHRVCPFCEATCGLAIQVEGDAITSVRGDKQDPFSRGFLCPKAHGLKELHHEAIDDFVFRQLAGHAIADRGWDGLDVDEVFAKVDGGIGPARIVDLLLRVGPHGDGFGRRPGGLTLARLQDTPHGIDLGPLEPRLAEVIDTPSGAIELAPPAMTSDLARLRARMAERTGDLLLIGRREMRWSNSFMHNLPALVKGRDRCTLQVCSKDADRIGLAHGGAARVTSRVGSVVAPVEVTDDLMPGVVSLPHGWGHDDPASRLRVANAHPGVNINVLTDDRAYDQASGTAVLFGTPVTVESA